MRLSCFIIGILTVISTVFLTRCFSTQEMPSSFIGLSGEEEVLCNLNRMDQQGEDAFICEAYERKRK